VAPGVCAFFQRKIARPQQDSLFLVAPVSRVELWQSTESVSKHLLLVGVIQWPIFDNQFDVLRTGGVIFTQMARKAPPFRAGIPERGERSSPCAIRFSRERKPEFLPFKNQVCRVNPRAGHARDRLPSEPWTRGSATGTHRDRPIAVMVAISLLSRGEEVQDGLTNSEWNDIQEPLFVFVISTACGAAKAAVGGLTEVGAHGGGQVEAGG
jgi:hypothetical protein